ncbi:MAG: hypothetical protein NZ750_12950 [Anaerolineae bacterium]|nr:hypothetical protein [Anaerolineae bacterium]MDW8173684.1 hypothetical protein [Anaerolineae bacterium]
MSLETLLSFALSLIVLSYLLGDNWLFRLAMYAFVGLAAAFTVIATVEGVILPLVDGDPLNALLLIGGLILVALLLLKPLRFLTPISNLALALLIAVGSAVALIGAISGTLLPLMAQTATPSPNGLAETLLIFVGVVSSLMYFQYAVRRRPDGALTRPRLLSGLMALGQGFVVVTLGALYGAAILTSLAILTGQLSTIFGGG